MNKEAVKNYIQLLMEKSYELITDGFHRQGDAIRMSEVEVPVSNLPEPESVYFVFEYIDMDVAGCISWLKHDIKDIEDLPGKIKRLEECSLLNEPALLEWINDNLEAYPDFIKYQLFMDYLRGLVLEYFCYCSNEQSE